MNTYLSCALTGAAVPGTGQDLTGIYILCGVAAAAFIGLIVIILIRVKKRGKK